MNQDMMSAKLPSETKRTRSFELRHQYQNDTHVFSSHFLVWTWMVDGRMASVPPKQRGTQPAASRTPALEEHLRGQPTDHISFPATTSNRQQAMVHACR